MTPWVNSMRAIRHDSQTRKAYRDLKGRSFDKQIRYRVMF